MRKATLCATTAARPRKRVPTRRAKKKQTQRHSLNSNFLRHQHATLHPSDVFLKKTCRPSDADVMYTNASIFSAFLMVPRAALGAVDAANDSHLSSWSVA